MQSIHIFVETFSLLNNQTSLLIFEKENEELEKDNI